MKKLRISATITVILGVLSVNAMMSMFLALCDIADPTEPVKTEWRVVGIGMIILGAFIISTFITVGYLLKSIKLANTMAVSPAAEN